MTQPALFATGGQPNRQPIPAWLLDQLDKAGHIDAAAGASRRARPATCPRCRATVIRALDDDWCALAVDADPEPLNAEGEAIARLLRMRTFELRQYGGRWQLERRDQWSIAGRPAGSRPGVDVLAEHQCQPVVPLPRGPSRIPPPADTTDLPDQPPY